MNNIFKLNKFAKEVVFFNEIDFDSNYKEFLSHLTDTEYSQFMGKYGELCQKLEELLKKYNEIVVRRLEEKQPIEEEYEDLKLKLKKLEEIMNGKL